MTENPRTGIRDVHTVSVPVTDQDRALAFFVDVLGFEKRLDVIFGGGMRWIQVAPPGSRTSIAIPPPGGTVPPVDTGIRLASTSVDADHASLVRQGVDVDAEVIRMGEGVPPMFSLRDPDGNTLYIVEITD